jgi:hypothetical protein
MYRFRHSEFRWHFIRPLLLVVLRPGQRLHMKNNLKPTHHVTYVL